MDNTVITIIVVSICLAVIISAISYAISKISDYLKQKVIAKIENVRKIKEERKKLQKEKQAIEILSKEKTMGFPWLAQALADYHYYMNLEEAKYMENKKHPAPVSAEKIREIAIKRRIIEKKLRITQGVIKYYQNLFPFLEEFTDDVDDETLQIILSRNIDEPIYDISDIGVDPVTLYLSSEEYKNISSIERNQLALDRYWSKHKSKWEIGRGYERYIGYIYESDGYTVYYQGILEGFDDLGRDLICKKGNKTVIVQCKCWSEHKAIHEKHINQLYGTLIKYVIDNPNEEIGAVLYTTTSLSDRAREFSEYLNIAVAEKYAFDTTYPSIKCNISKKNREKIYHLPFDQQYDRTIIEEEKNEFYAFTVAEAEEKGFRRAWRWKGGNLPSG